MEQIFWEGKNALNQDSDLDIGKIHKLFQANQFLCAFHLLDIVVTRHYYLQDTEYNSLAVMDWVCSCLTLRDSRIGSGTTATLTMRTLTEDK